MASFPSPKGMCPSPTGVSRSDSPRHQISESGFSNWSDHLKNLVVKRRPFGSGYVIPDRYAIPTHILAEIFRVLDRTDSPAQPGRLRYDVIKSAMQRFHDVLSDPNCEVEICIAKLREQAERRKQSGSPGVDEVAVRWDQDFVLDSFQVKLGMGERIFFTFDISENSTWASQSITWIGLLAVFVSIFTFVLGTTPNSERNFGGWVPWVDVVCVTIFTLDYITRLLTVPSARMELLNRRFLEDVILGQQDRKLLTSRQRLINFLLSPMGLVDIVSVVPFWVELGIGGMDGLLKDDDSGVPHAKILRVFRIVRLVRVFKLGILAKADLGEDRNMVLHLFKIVLAKAQPALHLVFVLVLLAMILFGTLIWAAERGELFQKDSPTCPVRELCAHSSIRLRLRSDGTYEESASPFESVPISFWWVIVTITTVGYGDYYPVTRPGYIIGAITILYGVVVFALPVGIIGTAFSQAYDQFQNEQTLRKRLQDREEETSDSIIDLVGFSTKHADLSGPPPLVLEFIEALQQNVAALGLASDVLQIWEESFQNIATFESIMWKHPCESLQSWGTPVIATLSQLVPSQPLYVKFYNQTISAWCRLLLHTAQAYEEFYPTLDRNVFLTAMHGEMVFGTVRSSQNMLDGRDRLLVRTSSRNSQRTIAHL